MHLPGYLEQYRVQAREMVPTETIFSGPTYQIAFDDHWVFLQLDENGEVKDLFCQCDACAENGTCVHMAAAYFSLFSRGHLPVHEAFERSVFYTLFFYFAGQNPDPAYVREGAEFAIGQIRCTGDLGAKIEQLVTEREEESEETSIKFSSLSEHELSDWYRGKPSARLAFELSPYGDIAKELFLLQVAQFSIENDSLVCELDAGKVVFPKVSEGLFEEVLERLPPERTQPRIERYGGLVVAKLKVQKNGLKVVLKGDLIALGEKIHRDWYRFNEGFVRKWSKRSFVLTDEEVRLFLDDYFEDTGLRPVQYDIRVEQGLQITPYLYKQGDLAEFVRFNSWIWNEQIGFVRIDSFPTKHTVSLEELDAFLRSHRYFFKHMPGYRVHETPFLQDLSYEVKSSGALVFSKRAHDMSKYVHQELGEWVWVQDHGFYLIRGEQKETILPYRVAEYLREHREELSELLFASSSPIADVGLRIKWVKKDRIDLLPVYHYANLEYEQKVRFYENFGYIPEIGFFSLPTLLAQNHFTRTLLEKDREEWDRFFLEQLEALKKDFHVDVDPALEFPQDLRLFCRDLQVQEEEIEEWRANFYWQSEKGRVDAEVVLAALRQGVRFLPTPAGLLDLQDQRFGWLRSISLPRKAFALHSTDFFKIRAHEELSFDQTVNEKTVQCIEQLFSSVPPEPPILKGFKADLRSYQQKGVDWLWHLYLTGLSGLLCDDMGVGKTYQAMALLNAVREKKGGSFLIVCPTSIAYHWIDKCHQVLPEFSLFAYIGINRESEGLFEKHDIIITTYGVLRNEIKTFKKILFEVAIFDELQIAKNHVSQVWAALAQIRSQMRLGLTGTPVENQTRELKALFDIVLPGYFPRDHIFRSFYIKPIEKEASYERRQLLARFIRPFILRRRKEDVLPDLPPKTEDTYVTELLGEQRSLYRQVASRQGMPIVQQLQDADAPVPYLHIFALLSSLKQICNHPAAYLRDVEKFQRYESGKWNVCIELLEEARESGQKVVIFSQFLSMLDIFKRYFEVTGIGFTEIRGSTKNRREAIACFHEDPNTLVFLGSLQAAGLGIDLTPASILIHYDRWWNAARENQATDRVHRFGQQRGVMVYKLLTSKSVEERIDHIISHKAQLFEELIRYDDHQIVKKLSRSELLELLQGLDSV